MELGEAAAVLGNFNEGSKPKVIPDPVELTRN